jgi:UDP-3-O-[3-hydroxymyristoyl] N-acetylglucosamine deacetylase
VLQKSHSIRFANPFESNNYKSQPALLDILNVLMAYETTIGRPLEVQGVGLHHGAPVTLRIAPAPPATGIVFIRTDLDRTRIPASWKFVERVSYATSLMHPKGIFISTTEHLLSVLYGMGIDNAFIELNNLELPILDGSSLPFVQLLKRAGSKESRRPRRYMKIVREVRVESGEKSVAILPCEGFHLRCHSYFDHPMVGEQNLELEITPDRYSREIAPARTFGFEYELDQMRDQGLIRGATLENAICFTRQGVLNPGGLRFRDECCRHKALDLIGDLALIGRPLLGQVVAKKAGHAMHVALVNKIMSDPSLYEIVTLDRISQPLPQAVAALV